MEDLNTDSSAFVVEEIEPMCIAAIDAVLKDQHYDEAKVALQANYICEDIMAGLVAMKKPFKYVVNCLILQNTGAALQVALSEFVDPLNDGVCIARWPSDKAKDTTNIMAACTIIGLAL